MKIYYEMGTTLEVDRLRLSFVLSQDSYDTLRLELKDLNGFEN